jgi:peroxiredoxin Q/BCP
MHVFEMSSVMFFLPPAAMAFFDKLKAADLKPGDAAPDFTLPGSDGKIYSLADFRGKQAVVLAWFPKAFTPGCTSECKAFAAGGPSLRKFNAAYFTASVDPPEKNKKFAESVGADYPILSDADGKIARAYGVTGAVQKFASRWTFYIGPDGKILYIDKNVNAKTHADDVAIKLKELGVAEKK